MASTSDSMEDVVVLEPEAAAAGAAGAPVAWTVPQALGVVTVARDQLIRTLSRRGGIKYDRVSSGKGSIPKLFRIDPADADVVESAARGIVLQHGLQAAGKAGSGTGSKKKPKNKATGPAKRSTKAGAGGAGAAVGSTDVGTEGDGGGGITGLLKHIRLRACPRTGLRSTVTQFTVGK